MIKKVPGEKAQANTVAEDEVKRREKAILGISAGKQAGGGKDSTRETTTKKRGKEG